MIHSYVKNKQVSFKPTKDMNIKMNLRPPINMQHPTSVLYLEHDGKVLLVDSKGNGLQKPVQNRRHSQNTDSLLEKKSNIV